MFIDKVVDADVDYIVHLDEDCFVWSAKPLVDLITLLEQDPSAAAAGIPDGGYFYRDHNPAALNLFFVIFRADALRAAWQDRHNWTTRTFKKEYACEVFEQCSWLDRQRIHWDKEEPYYALFWSMLASGGRFLYLQEVLDASRWSSKVLEPSGGVAAEHMWYVRHWFSDERMPGHNCPNSARYASLKHSLCRIYRYRLSFRVLVWYMHAKRLMRRSLQ